MISPEKELELKERMARLHIKEADLRERFIKGAGPGGQKINKTSSCVQLLHVPSGIEVKCAVSRSQAMNRFLARRQLCERLERTVFKEKSAKEREIARIRRQKRRRTKRRQEKMLKEKRIRAETKANRKAVDIEN